MTVRNPFRKLPLAALIYGVGDILASAAGFWEPIRNDPRCPSAQLGLCRIVTPMGTGSSTAPTTTMVSSRPARAARSIAHRPSARPRKGARNLWVGPR